MSEEVENNGVEEPRLSFEKESDWYRYSGIPYEIYYILNKSTGTLVDDKNPGKYRVTPNTGGGESLSIWVHESVPGKFRDIVMFHELTEARYELREELEVSEAHNKAVTETEAYAKRHLSAEDYAEFVAWQSTLDQY